MSRMPKGSPWEHVSNEWGVFASWDPLFIGSMTHRRRVRAAPQQDADLPSSTLATSADQQAFAGHGGCLFQLYRRLLSIFRDVRR